VFGMTQHPEDRTTAAKAAARSVVFFI